MNKIKTKRWNSAEHLKTDDDAADYLDACLQEASADIAFIEHSLRIVAQAKLRYGEKGVVARNAQDETK